MSAELEPVADAEFDTFACNDESVLCLGVDGAPLLTESGRRDTVPAILMAGTAFQVLAVSRQNDRGTASLSIRSVASADTLTRIPAPAQDAPATAKLSASIDCQFTERQLGWLDRWQASFAYRLLLLGHEPPTGSGRQFMSAWEAWLDGAKDLGPSIIHEQKSVEVASGLQLRVSYRRTGGLAQATRTYEIEIDNGRYYVDFGIMAPVVFGGDRSFYERVDLGTGERRIAVDKDVRFSAAAMIEFFPFGGRARNRYWFYEGPNRRSFSSLVGFQLGTSIAQPAKEFYVGLSLEPIAGLSVGVGVAAIKGKDFPKGIDDRDYIPRGDSVQLRERYLAHPYLGFTVSAELLKTLASVRATGTVL
ncbi:MAG TPA: hypothetical protein VFX59_00500 [Polyangiales bacterium]|nr:hypothetical protein [Polyangiales bacterium]